MEQWRKDLLDLHERVGYIPTIRELARSHACPFYWYDDSLPVGNSVLHNGTITFVNTGAATIAISAFHVYNQYIRDRAKGPHIRCQFGSATVEPERYLFSSDENLDLVTFKLPDVLIAATRVAVHSAVQWPPDRLKQSDLVVFGGYPGHRRTEKYGTLESDFVTFISRVNQSSDDHASVYLNIPESHWPADQSIGEQPDLGGVSGGPVFRFLTQPIEMLEFAGIIYESSQTFELVYARHADHISEVGAIA